MKVNSLVEELLRSFTYVKVAGAPVFKYSVSNESPTFKKRISTHYAEWLSSE